ncbi:hypothetical protein QBC39DRAFT_330381 [Podospora conica]|nr:hypothetical protein QBC39DRAFT_330381 [Schizothecium conicum]
MKKLTFSLLALCGLAAAIPSPDLPACDDPRLLLLTKHFEDANVDISIPFCSSLLAGEVQTTPAANFQIEPVTLPFTSSDAPEPTTTTSPEEVDDDGDTTTTTPSPPPSNTLPTRPRALPRRHLHALNHRDSTATSAPLPSSTKPANDTLLRKFFTRTTTTTLPGTLTAAGTIVSTATTSTTTTAQPLPVQMKIAHPGPGPGFARVALAAHRGGGDEVTTTRTTTVEVTATAGTVTVTPPVAVHTSGSGFLAGGHHVVRVGVVEGEGGSGSGSNGGGVRPEAVVDDGFRSNAGVLQCPGQEARGYCCSPPGGVGSNSTVPNTSVNGTDGGGSAGVECQIPSSPEPKAPNCPADHPVPLCCITLAGDTQAPELASLGDVRLLRCAPPSASLATRFMASPPESTTTDVVAT